MQELQGGEPSDRGRQRILGLRPEGRRNIHVEAFKVGQLRKGGREVRRARVVVAVDREVAEGLEARQRLRPSHAGVT